MKKTSRHFPCGCGTDIVPIESKPSGRRGHLVGQHGSVEATGESDRCGGEDNRISNFPQARQGQEATILRPCSEKVGLG